MAKTFKGKSTIENSTIKIESTASNEDELEKQLQKELEQELNEQKNTSKKKEVDFNDVNNSTAEEKVEINFDDENDIKNFTASRSKESTNTDNVNGNSFYNENTTEEELRDKIKQEEEKSKEFKAKDFEDIAKFIIFLLDASLSSLLRWWAKDTADTAYSLGAEKKNQLVQQLTLILVKYQTKFSIEFMFLITVLVLYIPPFLRAKDHRKEKLNQPIPVPVKPVVHKKEEKKPEMKIVKEDKVEEFVVEQKIEEEVVEQKVEEEIVVPVKKTRRKRGAPPKN